MADLFGKTVQDHIQDFLSTHGDWATIDDLVAGLDQADAWDAGFTRHAVALAKKEVIRKAIRQIKDDDGWADVISIEKKNEEGEKVRLYKRESLFDLEDYRQAVRYNHGRTCYFARVRDVLRDHAFLQFGEHIPIPQGNIAGTNP